MEKDFVTPPELMAKVWLPAVSNLIVQPCCVLSTVLDATVRPSLIRSTSAVSLVGLKIVKSMPSCSYCAAVSRLKLLVMMVLLFSGSMAMNS